MNPIGIYFGPKVIDIVQTKGKSVVKHLQIPHSTIFSGELDEKVPASTKIIEVIALIKDELRRSKIDVKEAVICLSGKDLLIRNFEIPLMPNAEVASAINFEAKKYIPFKVEDLISGHQVVVDKASHTNLVLFMGMKKDTFEKYLSIARELNLKISAIEYAAFGLNRLIKSAGLSDRGVVAVLGAELSSGDEANFTVTDDGFPLFSRDMALIGEPQELGLMPGAQASDAGAMDKLKNEIRLSLDYYNRKLPSKGITKLYIISDPEHRQELEAYGNEMGIAVKFVDLEKVVGSAVPFSLGMLKAYNSSFAKAAPSGVRINLLAFKEIVRPRAKTAEFQIGSLFSGLQFDFRFVAFGLGFCALAYGWGLYQALPIRQQVKEILSSRVEVASIKGDSSYQDISSVNDKLKKKLDVLDALIKKQLLFTEPLNFIPRVIPKGVWLTSFSYRKRGEEAVEINLNGLAYLDDSNEEFATVNQFASNLKEDPKFGRYFKNSNVTSLNRSQLGKVSVTNFTIACKN